MVKNKKKKITITKNKYFNSLVITFFQEFQLLKYSFHFCLVVFVFSDIIISPYFLNIPVGFLITPSKTPLISASLGGASLLNPAPTVSLISDTVFKPCFFPYLINLISLADKSANKVSLKGLSLGKAEITSRTNI